MFQRAHDAGGHTVSGNVPAISREEEKSRILDVAERFARHGGYFSFDLADIEPETGLTSAEIRSHFKSKQELATALVYRYIADVEKALGDPRDTGSMERLVAIWSEAAQSHNQMCLCSLYGAEIAALPEEVAKATQGYYSTVSDWIHRALGCPHDEVHAEAILASLCGTLITVKSMNRAETFDAIIWQMIRPIINTCGKSAQTTA
ncbi:MAG: TetR/AcrR family transcriptional regulator [Pseudomonadota bacterium]